MRQSEALQHILLLSVHTRMDATCLISGKVGPLASGTVLQSILTHQPDLADKFCCLLSLDRTTLSQELKVAVLEPEEAAGEPPYAAQLRESIGREYVSSSPMSKAVTSALHLGQRRAIEEGRQLSVSSFLSNLLRRPCQARTFLIHKGFKEEDFDRALEAIVDQPDDPISMNDFLDRNMKSMRSLMDDLMTPENRDRMIEEMTGKPDELRGKLERARDEAYERNPELHDTKPNLPAKLASASELPDQPFFSKVIEVMSASEYEARSRKAPLVTLEHLLLALLVPGTDTWALIEVGDGDPTMAAQALDNATPRFVEGPRWPEKEGALIMAMPSDRHHAFDWTQMHSGSNQRDHMSTTLIPFSDILFLDTIVDREERLAAKVLFDAGVTKLRVKEAIRLLIVRGEPGP